MPDVFMLAGNYLASLPYVLGNLNFHHIKEFVHLHKRKLEKSCFSSIMGDLGIE